MSSNILKTPVDDLVVYIKETKSCKVSEIVQKFHVPLEYIERWLVILEEANILKLSYSKFEGFIEYVEDQSKLKSNTEIDVDKLKEIFLRKSEGKKLSSKKTYELWKIFIKVYEAEIKKLFFTKARARGFPTEKIENAWILYKEDLRKL